MSPGEGDIKYLLFNANAVVLCSSKCNSIQCSSVVLLRDQQCMKACASTQNLPLQALSSVLRASMQVHELLRP